MAGNDRALHTLIPLGEFMSIMGADDRDGKICRFCLATSTLTIEGHCRRRLLRRRHVESVEVAGGADIPLGEYPVDRIFSVSVGGRVLEPGGYRIVSERGSGADIPHVVSLSRFAGRLRGTARAKIDYRAGYAPRAVPADLAAACLELASWNMARYRGRRIGMTGSVAGNWRDGEHLEMSMPENVVALLEPYRRKTI